MKIKKPFFIIIFFFSLCMLFSFGKKDSPFKEIDALMATQDYDRALVLLQEYIIKNPYDFDAAQKRIKKIISTRTSFSETADELILTIVNEPLDDKKKLEMIANLEALLEKNPNDLYLHFIQETKSAAQFTYYRAVFDDIMERGEELINNESYAEAIDVFYSGLDLYQKEFFEENWDPLLKEETALNLSHLPSLIANFNEALDFLKTIEKDFSNRQNGTSLDAVLSYFSEFYTAFENFASYQNEIQTIGQFFNDSFLELQKENPLITEASFLPFANRFVLGRQNSNTTGIIASYNQQWEKIIEPLVNQSNSFIEREFNKSMTLLKNLEEDFQANTIENLNKSFAESEKALTNTENIIALYTLKNDNNGIASEYQNKEQIDSIGSLKNLLDEYALFVFNYKRFEDEKNNFYDLKNELNSSLYSENLFNTTEEILDIRLAFNISQERLLRIREPALENSIVYFDSFEENLEIIKQKTMNYLIEEWNTFAHLLEDEGDIRYRKYEDIYLSAVETLNAEKKEHLETFLTHSYPKESLVLFNDLLSDIDRQIQTIDENQRYLLEARNFNPLLYTNNVDEASGFLLYTKRELENFKANSLNHISIANEMILLSERAKNEAILRISQVEDAIKKEDFEAARNNLARAGAKYIESLDYQESESLRTESDEQLALLGAEITRKENEIVIRDVRNLKNNAKTAYYQGNFERAENLLIQAENRFAVTNIEKDEETTSLLILVSTALSMKTGRVILPSAPLYPEMSQILSIAKQYYEKGQSLLNQSKRTEALAIFNDAKKKIRELQIVYPLNQEASLLVLRIDQLIDPASFSDFFAQRFTQAKNDFQDLTKRQIAYTDLLDLAEINPRYPGLSDFIYNAEIELGIRIRPPDQRALAESRQLTQEAALIVNSSSRDEIQLNTALAKLNTALERNPDNEEAMILKDRVQIMIGGRASIVLSSESEELYQRAILELQRGNVLQAAGIVNTLLQKRENQNSSKIIDLKKKVDSLL